MPTGYTDIINRGATFQDYAWQCADAFMPRDINALKLLENGQLLSRKRESLQFQRGNNWTFNIDCDRHID